MTYVGESQGYDIWHVNHRTKQPDHIASVKFVLVGGNHHWLSVRSHQTSFETHQWDYLQADDSSRPTLSSSQVYLLEERLKYLTTLLPAT